MSKDEAKGEPKQGPPSAEAPETQRLPSVRPTPREREYARLDNYLFWRRL